MLLDPWEERRYTKDFFQLSIIHNSEQGDKEQLGLSRIIFFCCMAPIVGRTNILLEDFFATSIIYSKLAEKEIQITEGYFNSIIRTIAAIAANDSIKCVKDKRIQFSLFHDLSFQKKKMLVGIVVADNNKVAVRMLLKRTKGLDSIILVRLWQMEVIVYCRIDFPIGSFYFRWERSRSIKIEGIKEAVFYPWFLLPIIMQGIECFPLKSKF